MNPRLFHSLFFLCWMMVGAAQAATELLPLSRFTAQPGPLKLTKTASELDLFVPVSPAVQITKTVLELQYVTSAALLPESSYLAVRLNEATLAQVKLRPTRPQGTLQVVLPPELWRGGFNKLTIAVSQHYKEQCEDPDAPDLWTEVDLAASNLRASFEPLARPKGIADLSGVFAPGIGSFEEVTFVTAPGADPAVRDEALPYLAQALAGRRQYEPLLIGYRPAATANTKSAAGAAGAWSYLPENISAHALVGTVDELIPLLPPGRLEKVDGPYVTIDGDAGRVRLIVTGPTPASVIIAARNLGLIEDAVNPSDAIAFLGRPGEPMARWGATRLVPGETYRFDALGTDTRTFNGSGRYEADVNLPLAPDFYTYEGAQGELLLDFGYGAGMGPGSVLNINVNGKFLHGINFDDPNGSAFHNYRLSIPARMLSPGDNTLTFAFNLRAPQSEGVCTKDLGRHLFAQLLGNSTFTLPEGGNAAILPDLSLFASAGYPYVADDGATAVIYLSTENLRGSALTLIGRLAQAGRTTTTSWRIASTIPDTPAGRAIMLGTADSLPPRLFDEWSAAIGKIDRWPYRSLQAIRPVSASKRESVAEHALGLLGLAQAAEPHKGLALEQQAALGPLGVITAFRAPGEAAAIATVIVAEDADTLRQRVNNLVSPAIWGQLSGDLVAWRDNRKVHSMSVAQPYAVGERNPWLLLRIALSNNPLWWLAGAGIAISLIVLSAGVLLKRRARAQSGRQ